ncbi:MAG: outer membrane beta-barrel protein, partial [Bdellovibrionota bacterium]
LMASTVTVFAQDGAKTSSQAADSGSSNVNTNTTTSEAKAENGPVQARSEVVIITPVQTIEQPTTVVSASPLAPSEADELRKARERAEIETEQKIVEKLERSRLQDEQKRLNRLFKPLDEEQEKPAVAVIAPVAPVVAAPVAAAPVVAAPVAEAPAAATTTVVVEPKQDLGDNSKGVQTITIETGTAAQAEASAPVVAAPEAAAAAAVVVPAVPQKSEEEIRSEVTASVKADLAQIQEEEKKEKKSRFSVGGSLLSLDYADAYNVSSDFGAGVSVGWEGPNRLGVEAAFIYSQHTIDESYSLYKQVDQYNWSVTARYSFLPWKVTPVVGAIASYTRRDYTDMYSWGYSSVAGRQSASSDSIDAGLLLGVDFNASKNITLGVEYRYMTNMNSKYSDPESFNRSVYDSNNKYYQTLEDIDYDMIGFNMKFLF